VPTLPSSSDASVQTLRILTTAFCGALVLIGILLFTVLLPDGDQTPTGLAVGLALGVVGFLASRSVPAWQLRPLDPGEGRRVALPRLMGAAFLAIALAEGPALIGLVVAFATDGDRGAYLVAAPLGVISIVLNGTGTPALRRHVARLESRGGSAGIPV
jgi:hypothetical protein